MDLTQDYTQTDSKLSFNDIMGEQTLPKFTRKQKRYQENKAKKQQKEIQKRNEDPKFLMYRVNQLQSYVVELVKNPESELANAIRDAVTRVTPDGTI